MTVIALKQLEIEPPILLAEALTDELFERLKMKKYPVLIFDFIAERTHGFSTVAEYTEKNEIVIASELLVSASPRLRGRTIERIIDVYLHECAHRILQNSGDGKHDAAF